MAPPTRLVREIRCHIGGLLDGRLACLGTSEKQSGPDQQHRHWDSPRQLQKRVRDTGADRDRLHRVAPGSGGDVLNQTLASGANIVGDLGLDRFRAEPLTYFAGGLGNAGSKLLNGLGKARTGLFGFPF